MCKLALALAVVLVAGCGGESVEKDPGPAPGADHQQQVRAAMERHMTAPRESWQAEYDGIPDFEFSAPVADRVARASFEPETGRPHSFGYVHGWRVDFRYTPKFVGFPDAQPECHAIGFFRNGRLLGIFRERDAPGPLDLAKWEPVVVLPEGVLPLPTSPAEAFR